MTPSARAERFLQGTLSYPEDTFDAVLLWDMLGLPDGDRVQAGRWITRSGSRWRCRHSPSFHSPQQHGIECVFGIAQRALKKALGARRRRHFQAGCAGGKVRAIVFLPRPRNLIPSSPAGPRYKP